MARDKKKEHPNARGGVKPENLASSAVRGRSYKSPSGSGRAESAGYTTSSPGWRREGPAPAPKRAAGGGGGGHKSSGGKRKGGGGDRGPRTTGAINRPQQGPQLPENVRNATSPTSMGEMLSPGQATSPTSLGDMLSPGQATSPSSLGGMLYPGQMTSPSSVPGLLGGSPGAQGQPPAPQGVVDLPALGRPPAPQGVTDLPALGQPPAPQGVTDLPALGQPPAPQNIVAALLQRLNNPPPAAAATVPPPRKPLVPWFGS